MFGLFVVPGTFLFVLLVLYSYFDPEFTETYVNSVFTYIDEWGNTKSPKPSAAAKERRRLKPSSSRSSSRHSPATVTPTGRQPSTSQHPSDEKRHSSRSSRRNTPAVSPTTVRRRALHRMQREAQREVLMQQLNQSTPEKDIWADFTPKESHQRSSSTLSMSRSHSHLGDELVSPKSARSSSSRSKANGSSRSSAQTPTNGDHINASYTDDWNRFAGSATSQHSNSTTYQRALNYSTPHTQQQPTNGFYDVSLQAATSLLPIATPPLHPHTRTTSTPGIQKAVSANHLSSPPPASIYAALQQQNQYTAHHSPAVSPEPVSAHSPHPYYQYHNQAHEQPPAVIQYNSVSPQPLSPGFYSTAATASPTFAAQRRDVHESALDY